MTLPLLIRNNPVLSLLILSAILFLPFLGWVHLFDWDEINFAESAREMLVSGEYFRVQIDFQPFWEKPPLFIWLQALSMQLFGVNEFAARFPNALAGFLTLISLYFVGRQVSGEKIAWLWPVIYLGSFLPHIYFKSGIIDPLFNLFIFLGVVFFWRMTVTLTIRDAVLLGLFTGLAVLTKGPVGLLLVGLASVIYFFISRVELKNIIFLSLGAFGVMLAVSFLWYGVELIRNGPWFMTEFIQYQIRLLTTPDAGHQQPIYYHFLVVLIGCFPMSVLALPAFLKKESGDVQNFRRLMLIIFWVVMILFSLVKTKIVHYSSMSYFPLSFLAALAVKRMLENRHFPRWQLIIIGFIGLIFGGLMTVIPIVLMDQTLIEGLITSEFSRSILAVQVPWGGWEWIPGAVLMAGMVFFTIAFWKTVSENLVVAFFGFLVAAYFLLIPSVVKNVEGYTQRTLVNFCKTLAGSDVYVTPVGFKSYAHYFYAQVKPVENPWARDREFLLNGDLDKPAYFITKIHRQHLVNQYPGMELVQTGGGYAFFRRLPPHQSE